MEKKDFKKLFPKLYEELNSHSKCISIDRIRWNNREDDPFYLGVIDFLRRCSSDEEGYEIINYMEQRNEITKEEAEDLRQQIKSRGIRS
ncbi:MAG: DUF2095 family protein, partial [Candidatus Odinarchaeia archaeon]